MKFYVYTFCYNEINLLPFIVKYWQTYATRVIVYDNYSTDGSREYLQQFDWIELRRLDTSDRYDPDKMLEIKNIAWKECKRKRIDFVQVCDIDEVLWDYDIKQTLMNIKNSKSTAVMGNVYECQKEKLPVFDNHFFAHEYYGVSLIKADFKKLAIFSPVHIQEINLTEYSQSCDVQGNVKFYNNGIYIFHLKMFGNDNMSQHVMEIMNRYVRRDINKIITRYGERTLYSCAMAIARITQTQYKHGHLLPLLPKQLKPFKKELNSYKDVKWKETSVQHCKSHEKLDKQCIIVVPIYSTILTKYEKDALHLLIKVMGGKYEICLVHPENMWIDYYNYVFNHDFSYLPCNNDYFKNVNTYSWLCEEYEWYKCFEDYKYMFLYQLDGWIFKDELQLFLDMDYDYIGGPWCAKHYEFEEDCVGNGGVSLRKISKFMEVLETLDRTKYPKRHVNLEDLLFCQSLANLFHFPDVYTASLFCFDDDPDYWYNYNCHQLPMCAHGWDQRLNFWESIIYPETAPKKEPEIHDKPDHKDNHKKDNHKDKSEHKDKHKDNKEKHKKEVYSAPVIQENEQNNEKDLRIALCAIAKNENLYIREWVEYYKKLGITKIFLYDNNDIDGEMFEDVIEDYINDKFVTVLNIRGRIFGTKDEFGKNLQTYVYEACYDAVKNHFDWICFFDIDEFLTIKSGTFNEFLRRKCFEEYDTILVNWENYNDNGLVEYDPRPVMERFTTVAKGRFIRPNFQCKSIVRCGRPHINFKDNIIHHKFLLDGIRVCNADGDKCMEITSPNLSKVTYNNAYLKHYVTKTIGEYIKRYLGRNDSRSRSTNPHKFKLNEVVKHFFMINKQTEEKQKFIENYVKQLESSNMCNIKDGE